MVTIAHYLPEIKTELPGPKTRALIERDHQVISPSYTRGYPLSIERGEGAMVIDVDGNRFLDYCAGIAVCSTGHSHPEVVEAIREQAGKFLHMSGTDFYYACMVELAEKLAAYPPGSPDKRVFFGNSGAEANEGAIKLARYHTGRDKIISFYGSFHGRTYGAMSVSASKALHKRHFAPMVSSVLHAHYPYFYRDMFSSATPEECAEHCLAYIKNVLFRQATPPDEVAAFIVEPIQGEGGYVVPPPNFLPELQRLARRHGILVICDEVQAGIGRTGKMWASEHYEGFEPDIITSAKGLASGLPLGAVIAGSHIMTWEPGTHASTFGGNPVSCVAALKTLELVETSLMQNAEVQGAYLTDRLRALREKYEVIGDVRGKGLMIGVEIIQSSAGREKAPDLRNRLVDDCFAEGLLLLGCGENTIRFSPPLVITREQTDAALDIFERALKRQA